ncbi:MAG: alpha/beta hydrolase family esterase [Fibrobacterota bacterium]|nr:PHB depolymerase family esterase [Chitinispirillaceae bacterium]
MYWQKKLLQLISLLLLLIQSAVLAGTYQEVTDFGDNPSNIKMFLYTPDIVASKPAVLVACHWCHGTAQDIYNGSRYTSVADKNGYIVIFPNAASSDGCWDVASANALQHNGGGDPLGIVSMVMYVLKKYNADSSRVYVLGVSSGAMMTNLLLGAYPDVFSAGAAFAGVPFGCFAGPNSWNADCAQGKITKTGAEWGNLVRAAYPEYTAKRPRIQMWHGTKDDVLSYVNFGEALKQWTNVHGIDTVADSEVSNYYKPDWTRKRYTNANNEVVVETIIEKDLPHNLEVPQEEALAFLGLDKTTGNRSGFVVRKNMLSKVGISVAQVSDGISICVQGATGNVGLSIYSVNGRCIYASSGMYSANNSVRFMVERNDVGALRSNVGIVMVTIDGENAGLFKVHLQ